MILEQHYLACLSQASYLIADEASKLAAVVDPRRDVAVYLDRARELGVEIRHVFLTHFHADFVSGHLELAEATGATIHIGERASAEFDFEPMRQGGSLELGDQVRLEFLETPGHTPESCSILVFDRASSEEVPHAVLTGDTLFIGDVGRPDLLASVGMTAEELAGLLYESTRTKLLPLPDETLVYPGHGAGSACGKNLSTDTVSTVGAQRGTNYALQEMSRAEFVGLVTAAQPPAPAYFSYDAALNKKKRETLDRVLERGAVGLSLEECLKAQADGAQLLDARSPDTFAAGHLAGSLNVGLDGRYATWAGTVLDLDRPIVVVAEEGRQEEAVLRLGRIGLDRVVGYLEDVERALKSADLVSFERVSAEELERRLGGDSAPAVLDVRQPGEREVNHIPGSVHIPLGELASRLAEVPTGAPLVVTCAGGYRSAIAVSLLERGGVRGASDLIGGMSAWEKAAAR